MDTGIDGIVLKIGRSEIVVLPDILHGYGILNTDTWEFEKK